MIGASVLDIRIPKNKLKYSDWITLFTVIAKRPFDLPSETGFDVNLKLYLIIKYALIYDQKNNT